MEIFENICRTCGNDCLEALNIYEDSAMVLDKKLPISDIISACLPANAALTALNKDDDYPKQICRICVKKLAIIYEFNNKWLTANNEFNVALKFEQRRKRGRQSQT
ncbi:Dip1, partial [Drosophila busckii]